MAEPRVLKLQSPAYGDPIFYKWPLVVTKRLDEPSEIADTIRLVCEDFPELKYAVENVILKDYDAHDFDSMNQLCQRYNKAMKNILQLWKGRAPPPRMFQPPNKELLRHIINLCYGHAIREPEKLNVYEPFSPEVYGETSFDMVAQILEDIQVSNEPVFLDLGSGVGQVVLQAAASNRFKECMGVEKADTPAQYAQKMEIEFKRWMDWFGKIYTEFTLEKGDFLDEKWRDPINDCGVVFVNNFAFGPVVNHHLKTRFQTMKEGSMVISSREFVPMNFKFNKRNLSELGAMIRVSEIKPKGEEATVSWTGNSISYFLHIVDRTRLEKYFSILKKKKDGQDLDEDEMSLCSETTNSVDTGTPVEMDTLEENLDDLYLGTTTRHQWQLLTDTINQSKQDGGKVMPGREAKTRGRIKQHQQALIKQTVVQRSAKMQMKNKILQKYGHQKIKKKTILPRQDSVDSSDSSDRIISRSKYVKGKKISNIELLKKKKFDSKKDLKVKPLLKLKRGRPSKKQPPKPEQSEGEESEGKASEAEETRCKTGAVVKVQAPIKTKTEKKKEPDPPKKEENTEDEVDKFLACMKMKYLDFIKRINTKEYAERLKVMIECETAKKKLLSQEISETERMVQNLISDSLRNFSSRLVELDFAVKTPLDLLSKSSVLAEKHRDLENKVVNMEIEVLNLEEKYKILCAARNEKNHKFGLEPMIDSDCEEINQDEKLDRKKEMEKKLCGAILNALNHRRTLMDQQSSLSDQISILEKISHTDSQTRERSVKLEDKEGIKTEEKVIRPKAKPVALVPPRMLSDDKKNTISPETMETPPLPPTTDPNRSRHGRRRKRSSKAAEAYEQRRTSPSIRSDSSQDSKTDLDERLPPAAALMQNRTSAALNGGTITTHSQQTSNTDQPYLTYQAHEQRAPIIFPTNPVDSSISDNMKNMKQFLKTSGKLLKAAPSKWESFQQESQVSMPRHRTLSDERSPSYMKTRDYCNFPKSPTTNQSLSDKGVSNVELLDKNTSLLYEKEKCSKHLNSLGHVSNEVKERVNEDSLNSTSNNFSLPINSLVLSTSSQSETSSNLVTTSYLNFLSENEYLQPHGVSMPGALNLCKTSAPPPYNFTGCTTIGMDDDLLSSTCTNNQAATGGITVNMLPNISHFEGKKMGRRHEKEQIEIGLEARKSNSASMNRKTTSVWTSSTFSVTHLQSPETSLKSLNNNNTLTLQTASNSKVLATSPNPEKNISIANAALNNCQSLPTTSPLVINRESTGTHSSTHELQFISNFFPASSQLQSYNTHTTSNTPKSKSDEKPATKKKRGRQPKGEKKKDSVVVAQGKTPNDHFHYTFGILPPENTSSGRGTQIADAGMKRKMEESFHQQYTNPDVEDHFRTSFNKLCQDANREAAISNLQEVGMAIKISPQTTATGTGMVNQGPLYRSSHNFICSGTTVKTSDVPMVTCSPSVNNNGPITAFVSDKPMTHARSHKDLPEYHRITGRPPAPMYDKNITPLGSRSLSLSTGGPPVTPVYCPSAMKLLKNNFECSKPAGPPVTLLIPAKGNQKELTTHSKMAVFASPPLRVSQGTSYNTTINNAARELRKPNPDMFLNSFPPGATFIQPPVPGGARGARPTFIPGGIPPDSKGHPVNDMVLRPPAPINVRARKPKKIAKKVEVGSTAVLADSGSHIDFAKCPTNNTSVAIMNPPTNNLINAGFRPPVIRNPMHSIQNLHSLSLDARSRMIRPRILGGIGPPVNRAIAPRFPRPDVAKVNASLSSLFQNRTPRPMSNTSASQKTPSPGSPTYNNPRYVLLNMPVVMVTTPNSESGQGVHRHQAMTSPTFPPPPNS